MDQVFSRPIHVEGAGGTDQWILRRSTRMAAFSIRPQQGDVIVRFKDGASGVILWEAEADNANGSHAESFGSYPLLFPNGIFISVQDESGQSNWDVSVAVIEPKSSGT